MNERPNSEQIKAQLAADIVRLIGEQKLSDDEVCVRLGITAADLVHLRKGDIARFSIDQLVAFAQAFDQKVELTVGAVSNPLRELLAYVDEVSARIPPEELEKFPTDMAANIDHYLYGSPRRD